ncbi:hypothetical protein Catovirus_2_195 [Catovirus CTV1]|uniref:Uncharacterized protein n=1 Tax=Catovirus CTV1 TaxID=1977631 RepID=A0A1V0SC15_9VIRU|nr:hypothetical protein Catovirus_2_195 [Catovirus CTV1]
MNTRYVFKNNNTKCDLAYNPEPATYKFYQVCLYKDPNSNKYHIRRCLINEHCKFIGTEEKKVSEKKYQYFLKTKKQNEYKLYPTTNLELVDLPNPGDILQVQSPLLNNNNDYSGYAFYN